MSKGLSTSEQQNQDENKKEMTRDFPPQLVVQFAKHPKLIFNLLT